MFGTRFISISVKLAAIIGLLLIVFIPLSNYVNILHMGELMEQNLESKAKALTATVAANCANAIVGGDFNFLHSAIADTMEDNPDAGFGIIVNKNNRVLVYLQRGSDGELRELDDQHMEELQDQRSQESWSNTDSPGEPYVQTYQSDDHDHRMLDITRPIFVDSTRWGTVRFGFSFSEVEALKTSAWQRAAIATALFVLVGVFVAYLISRRISRPVVQLVQDAATIQQGNFEKEITVSSSDEIGLLAHAFEQMRTSLKQQFREVAKRAMSLEGELDVFALPDLLQLVCSSDRTGRLVMESENEEGHIYVDGGEVVHAELSGIAGEFDGDDAVFRFFNWSSGAFKFEPMDLDGIPTTITTGWQGLIMEGARQTDEMSRIKQVIPSDDCIIHVVENPPEGVDEIQLTFEELQVSMLVEGQRPVGDIIRESPFEEFDTYQMLYRLASAGLVDVERR